MIQEFWDVYGKMWNVWECWGRFGGLGGLVVELRYTPISGNSWHFGWPMMGLAWTRGVRKIACERVRMAT